MSTTHVPAAAADESSSPRVMVIWCPDWPATAAARAADIAGDRPVAVLAGGRVVSCNAAARERGVRRGHRKREAEYRCPELTSVPRDPAVEARLFEPVITALETVTAGVEVTRPGLAAINVRGPARYYGGEAAARLVVSRAVASTAVDFMVGVADDPFAAALAARAGEIVPSGGSPPFLAPLPITVLGPSQESPLVDVLIRLGVTTLGDFATLPAADVASRFGPEGAWAHRLASGRDARPVVAREPPADFSVQLAFDDGLDRSDAVAFSARTVAERFVGGLADRGWACACVEIAIDFDTGEQLVRRWRHTGLLTSAAVIDRVRWQLDGVFAADPDGRSQRQSGSVTALRLIPVETVPLASHQLTLWGGRGERDEQAELGIARVQSQYGHACVSRLVVQGGTSPASRSTLIPWDEPADESTVTAGPWPGHLPAPAPAIVLPEPRPIRVLDEHGRPVTITDRGLVVAPPAALCLDGSRRLPVTAWTGPWPDSEHWWDPHAPQRGRRMRCQLVDVTGRAYVVTCRTGTSDPDWQLEAVYD